MKVPCDEGVAIHIGPKSCAVAREGLGEALTGERIGQPSSREESYLGCRHRAYGGRQHIRARHRERRTTRRGQRPWHVQTLLAREPGDLAIDRAATAAGPHREGEEP